MVAPLSQTAAIDWQGGSLPISRRFAEGYFAAGDGLAETEHVFLAGNDLPARFRPGFAIAELGFGTGLNALAAARAWSRSGLPGRLGFTSFEAFPLSTADMARALGRWPELTPWSGPLLEAWAEGARHISLPGLALTVIEGDARATLPAWEGRADAWFLDGFSPARNPELWEPALLAAVAGHSAPGATAATYSAAGHVRRALAAAGFAVTRTRGHGDKRHMTRARL